MSEAPRRRSTDNQIDLDTRVSVIETKQDYLSETISKMSSSLERHVSDEEGTVKKFTEALAEMNKTVIINTEALRHLTATFVTHTQTSENLTKELKEIDKRVQKHDIEVAKLETMGWTIAKVATVVSCIIGGIWAIASKLIGT